MSKSIALKIGLISSLCSLLGCGMDVNYHTITKEELVERRGATSLGYSEWEINDFYGRCDIYTLRPEEYIPQSCFEAVLQHEERHCRDGYFHGGSDDPSSYILNCSI